VKLTILGPPATKKTSQRIFRPKGGGIRVVPSKRSKDWEQGAIGQLVGHHLWDEARHGRLPLFTGRVSVSAQIYRARDVGDLVGYCQAIGDALQGGGGRKNRVPCVLADDRQIKSWDGSRLLIDRENPRVELEIEPFKEDT